MKFIRLRAALSLVALLSSGIFVSAAAQTPASSNSAGRLKIYFVDVEGGQSTLFVTPEGQSLLIDTGWQGNEGRDADRIVAVAKQAGLSRIDYVLLTHYHEDHVGGVPQLVARIPVGTFIDHGPNRELDHGITEHGYAEYQKVLATGKSQRILAHPGELLPIQGMSVRVISADGVLIAKPLPGAGSTQSILQGLRGSPCRSDRECAIARRRDYLWQAKDSRSRRPHLGQGDATDVPEQ